MKYGISHSFKDESLEVKAAWFQEKPLEERLIEALESIDFVNAILKFEPPDDRSLFKTFRVLERK
jgi:hypothetical protein